MKSLIYIVLFIFLIFYRLQDDLFAQIKSVDCIACLDTTNQLETLIMTNKTQLHTHKGKKLICHFLLCFDSKCSNAVELGEYSNEIIFKLLEDYPKLTLEIMSKNKKQIPWKNICDAIAEPINNVNNINEIIENIDAISGYSNVKMDVLNALNTAKDSL